MKRLGYLVLIALAGAACSAPLLAPHRPGEQFPDLLNAPPTTVHLRDGQGRWRAPFIYPLVRISQLEQRYQADHSRPIPLRWFAGGRLVRAGDGGQTPLLVLGADAYGRDVFSRLLFGARVSLGLSLVAAVGALCIGLALGGVAGYAGGAADELLMRTSEFMLVLPATYVALVLRAMLPLVLPPDIVFGLLAVIFAVLGAPVVARGVRTIVRRERHQEYATAAVSLGASHTRVLVRHLLPATRGYLTVQLTILVPSFVMAEATLSYVGFGFPDPVASWGTMLHDASTIRAFADFPWQFAPAAAMFLLALGVNLAFEPEAESARRTLYN
jgi:peptide/nickel transport system permease protein